MPSRTFCLALGLILASACFQPAQAKKDPTKAFLISAVPGALFHGAGNYYAGRKRTAGKLFLAELFGLALMGFDHPSGGIDQQIGDRDRDGASKGQLQNVGRVLFFGSWLFDLATSPEGARRRNAQAAREGLTFELEPAVTSQGFSFNPKARYRVRF